MASGIVPNTLITLRLSLDGDNTGALRLPLSLPESHLAMQY